MDLPAVTDSVWKDFRRGGGASGRIHDAFRRRLAPSGKALCGLWFAALVVSRVPGRTLAEIPFALLSCALVVAWLMSWRRVRLEAAWRAPDAMVVGEGGEIEVVLRNRGNRSVRDPGIWFFRCSDGLDFPGDGIHVPELLPGQETLLRVPVSARLRGPANLDPPHLLVVEPLGLMRSSRGLSIGGQILVKPFRPVLREFRFLGAGACGRSFAMALGEVHTRQGDPSGVREYREGDSMRDLHHRSWARRGRPVTRERTVGKGDGIRLEVSTAMDRRGDRAMVDDLLALASSIARWLGEHQVLGDAWIDGQRVAEGGGSLAEAVWEACGRAPCAGWGKWSRSVDAPLPPPGAGPVLTIGLSRDLLAKAGPDARKVILLDWMTKNVTQDESSGVLRISPLLVRRGDLAL